MIARTFDAAWKTLWWPTVLVPSALATIGSFLAFRATGVDAGVLTLSPSHMWLLGVAIGLRFWIGLSVSMTALSVMRGHFRWRPFRWASPSAALQACLVSVVLLVPVAAAAVLLVVPGVYLALRWSQAVMLIVDGRSVWFAAAEDSAMFTRGRRLEILSIWLIVGVALAVVEWTHGALAGIAADVGVSSAALTGLTLLARVVAEAFSLVVVAAIYYELDRDA